MWDLKQKHFKYFYILLSKYTKVVLIEQHILCKIDYSLPPFLLT